MPGCSIFQWVRQKLKSIRGSDPVPPIKDYEYWSRLLFISESVISPWISRFISDPKSIHRRCYQRCSGLSALPSRSDTSYYVKLYSTCMQEDFDSWNPGEIDKMVRWFQADAEDLREAAAFYLSCVGDAFRNSALFGL